MPIIKQNDVIDVIYETICGYEPEQAFKILELYRAKRLISIEWILDWHIGCPEGSIGKMIRDWERENNATVDNGFI